MGDHELHAWQTAVNNGLSCSFVSSTYCGRIQGCTENLLGSCIQDGSVPTINGCPDTISNWQNAVASGTSCTFVPNHLCDSLTTCQVLNGVCLEIDGDPPEDRSGR
eukprot:UN31040